MPVNLFCVVGSTSEFCSRDRYGVLYISGEDSGFPVRGLQPFGSADVRRGHLLAKIYAKTKELGPVRGRLPRSANVYHVMQLLALCVFHSSLMHDPSSRNCAVFMSYTCIIFYHKLK